MLSLPKGHVPREWWEYLMSAVGVWKIAAADPERIAVVAVDGTSTSYEKIAIHSNQLAQGLRALGLERGDRVAVVMRNAPELVTIILAAQQIGIYVVPINFHSTADDIAFIVKNSGARAVFIDAAFTRACREALDNIEFPKNARFCTRESAEFKTLSDWRRHFSRGRPDNTAAGSVMFYTSGTTGRPKGVLRPLPSGDGDEGAAQQIWILQVFGIEVGDGAHLVNSPMYHTAVFSLGMAALHCGQALIMMDEWEPELALQLIDRHRITSTHMVATHFHRLLSLSDEVKAKFDTKSLTYALHGAVPTPVDIKQRMMDWWGPIIYEYYGSSEVGGTLVTPEQWLAKPGTVGLPFSITRLEILDDDGNSVPNGEPGWIYMRQGDEDFQYHNDPNKTANVSRGNLVCVGDIGYLDKDGYLFLCGRDAEIIISGGVNIYPAAVEGHLLGHEAVHDVAVVGVPDDEFGEQVKAVVVTKPGYSVGVELEKQLIQHCRDELSHITCPRSVDFVNDLPRDPSGKMYKQRVRDQYWQGSTKRI